MEDNQKLWRGQLVRHHIRYHDLIRFCSFLPCLIDNLGCYNLFGNEIEILIFSKYSEIDLWMHRSKIFEMLGNKVTGR